jgi:hypothetical protein
MKFIFDEYGINYENGEAFFRYQYDDIKYEEKISFAVSDKVSENVISIIDKALFLSFVLIGTSYYKAFPVRDVGLPQKIDKFQADFFNYVYQEGLGQFAFENELTRDDLAHFSPDANNLVTSETYDGDGILCLQSGGKDSLLTAVLLKKAKEQFTPWYLSSGDFYPSILDDLGEKVQVSHREMDSDALNIAKQRGAKNGHVPVTFITESLAIIQALLLGKSQILVSIAHEGEEAHAKVGDMDINHQWSKTWKAEQLMAKYVQRYISSNIKIGSPLRQYSELKVAELFVKNVWTEFGHRFSSCNVANYQQKSNNSTLKWCGDCPKCANSYLLFAPFLPPEDLTSIFGGVNLFIRQSLEQAFKGLLGIDEVMKPFECVGEVGELRCAYHIAISKYSYKQLPFEVPSSKFDYNQLYVSQKWAKDILES